MICLTTMCYCLRLKHWSLLTSLVHNLSRWWSHARIVLLHCWVLHDFGEYIREKKTWKKLEAEPSANPHVYLMKGVELWLALPGERSSVLAIVGDSWWIWDQGWTCFECSWVCTLYRNDDLQRPPPPSPQPCSELSNILKTRQISTRNLRSLRYSASIWHPETRFEKSVFFFRKWRFSDVMSRDLGSKMANLGHSC